MLRGMSTQLTKRSILKPFRNPSSERETFARTRSGKPTRYGSIAPLYPIADGKTSSMPSQFLQVQITFPNRPIAESMANRLVEQHLAACTQVLGDIQSVYVWRGKMEHTREILLLAKTKTELFDRLVAAVRAEHPYECPQIVALPIYTANEDYLDWMAELLEN